MSGTAPSPATTAAPSPAGRSVTVIGLGPMGQAMAGAFLDRGYEVTLWNRTPSRADGLVARGATLATSVEEALRANELVVLSLIDYATMHTVLGQAEDALSGRVVVNLSSDTPRKTEEGARWVTERGAAFLAGGVTSPPSGIGDPASYTFYSGPSEPLERHRATLETLTQVEYLGEDPSRAALMYQIGMTMFWTSLLSYWQAIALANAHGLKAADILSHAVTTMSANREFFGFYADRIDAGNHAGDVDRLAMGTASAEHVLHTMEDSGVDTTLPKAVLELFERGMASGRAAESVSSLVEEIRAQGAGRSA
ncbi:NAD(P)-dependent oxidoreductase [Streptomyces sp. NPDC057638]|uniref:NAD(P)-dependent oxidoreductase n=1 Tax=Streptomyces sp. NPDC057638 TaxID=3346190 RepID=UPI003681BB30